MRLILTFEKDEKMKFCVSAYTPEISVPCCVTH